MLLLVLTVTPALGQNGEIVERHKIDLLQQPGVKEKIHERRDNREILKPEYSWLKTVRAEKITYLSDGLKVTGYLLHPRTSGKYPAIIYNRGGNREFGKITPVKVAFILARVASWGYVVAGSQYRGNDGGEGAEEFGGKEVNDILNLVPLLEADPQVDSGRMGLFGWSRGGMMTYLTLMHTCQFKAAVVGGGLSDLFMMMESRPDMEEVYEEVIPGYAENGTALLDARSAVRHADKICKTTPILMMHGTSDWRVVPQMALDLASAFQKEKIPYRLIMFEGGDHGLNEHDDEVFRQTRLWLDRFVRDEALLPDLKPHGK